MISKAGKVSWVHDHWEGEVVETLTIVGSFEEQRVLWYGLSEH